ncbi:MAG: AAA family ATPase [Nitrosomonadales bacterium]|nr:AAA family ATPase [Nitrosomonadales bacterium]
MNNPADLLAQRTLVTALLDGRRYPHAAKSVRLIETHISWVLLAGRYAYKIKKALDLGFLDFSALEARHFYCAEEIRLNRRLAPKIYLGIIPIGGNPEQPEPGAQPAIEYAVRMKRFASTRLMDRLLARDRITPGHMDSLAATMAHFHGSLPAAEADSGFGSTAAIRAAALQNFEQLRPLLKEPADSKTVVELRDATEATYASCEKRFEERRAQGCVRECHGDLHLGNIALIGDAPVPFDGIEFNPDLRWIDVMNEIAFPVMDLLRHQRPEFAYRLLNAYLEATGDYAGAPLLHFYIACRATVRAKVCAIRAAQTDISGRDAAVALAACRSYLALAGDSLARKRPALILTHGLPGSGKSTFAQAALGRLQALRIRSDVERKRLFGLAPLASSHSQTGNGMYGADATCRTYARLLELARHLLAAGFPVIVDAAFLKREERTQFRQLARDLAVPFAIASMRVSLATMRSRILERHRRANDASEAGVAVLEMLQAAQQPLSQSEQGYTVVFVNEGGCGIAGNAPGWKKLERLLATGKTWVGAE